MGSVREEGRFLSGSKFDQVTYNQIKSKMEALLIKKATKDNKSKRR